jgi:hypothetical protein
MAINTFGNLTVVGSANVTGNVSVVGGIIANGEIGTAGQVLTSNSSGIYWSSVTGSGINLDSTYTWTNTHTFTRAVNVTGTFQGGKTDIGNTVITGIANVTGNVFISGNVGIGIAPSTARQLYVYNGTSTGTSTDSATLTVKSVNRFAVVEIDSSASHAGAYIFKTAGTEAGRLHYDADQNYLSFSVNGSVFTTAERMRIDAGGNVGIGNTNPNAKLAVTGTANISGNVSITANVSITGGIIANGSIGTSGQILASNSSGIYWTTSTTGTVTSVSGANGITGGPITSTGTLYIVANTGIIANVTGLYVNSAYIATLSVNNTTYVNGKTESNLNVNSATSATNANNASYLNTKTEVNLNVNSAINSNSSTYLGGKTEANLNVNSATSATNANNASYLNNKTESNLNVNSAISSNNSAYLGGNLPAYYTNASNITTGTLPWAQAPVGTVNTTGNFTLNGNVTLSGTFTNVTGTFQAGKVDHGNTVITGTANVTGNVLASGTSVTITGDLRLANNDKQIAFATINTSAYVIMKQQSDDNFVLYTTNTAYQPRAVFSIFANTTGSNLSIAVPLSVQGNTTLRGTFSNVLGTFQAGKTDYGNTVITGTANVTGNVLASGTFVNVTGDLQSATLRTGLTNITGNATISGFANVTGTLQGTKTDIGNTVITGIANVTGNVLASGTFVNVTGTFQAGKVDHGNTVITGTANVTGNVLISGTFVNVTGTFQSTNSTLNGTFANVLGTFQAGKTNIGNTVITGTANVTGNVLASGTFVNVTGTFQAGKTDIGNTLITGTANVTGNVSITGGIIANGSIGTAGQVLASNSSGIYWTTAAGGTGTVTSVATGNGMTGGPVTTTGTVSVLANTGIVANTTGLYVNSAYIATINSNNAFNLGGVNATGYALLSGASFTGNVTLGGAFTNVTGTLQGTKTNIGNTVITGTANVTGNVLASGTFVNVTGTLQGTKTDIGNTVITGTANVTGNVLFSSATLFVDGTNDKVGINNTAPTVSLTISANAGAPSATFVGGNTFIRLASDGAYSEPAIEFAEGGFSPTAKIASKNEGNAGGSLHFITRDTSATNSTLSVKLSVSGSGTTTVNGSLSTGNTTVSGNLTISTGVVTGNGFGLTSVNYLSQSTSAVDVTIFGNTSAGGDINTWKDGTRFYPTLPSNINTLDMNIYTEIFIRQVADAVPTANQTGAGGPGNPELAYRVIKVPTAGTNTTLLTSDWQTISVPGSASFFLNSIRDTTPTAGNTVGYLLQYQWRTIASNPDANAGTISVASTTTLNATGTGTYFTSKLNTRLQISPGALAFRNINLIYGNRLLGVETAFGTAQTAVTYRVRDLYSNVSLLQTNVAFNFVGYK